MIVPVFAQESPINDVTNQLENQINQNNLKELENRISNIEKKINSNKNITNQNDLHVNANVTINDLTKFEFNLNSCKQNVTDNCREVGTKLDRIDDDIKSIKIILDNHASYSNVQWINALNMALAGILLTLSITTMIVTRDIRDKKRTEKNITNQLNTFDESIKNLNFKINSTKITENDIDVKFRPHLSVEQKEELDKLDIVFTALKSKDFEYAHHVYYYVTSLHDLDVNYDDDDNALFSTLITLKHYKVALFCFDLPEKGKDTDETRLLNKIKMMVSEKCGIFVAEFAFKS